MDKTERKITKIAREANKLTIKMMKEEGMGSAEFDFIHYLRHHPGVTQLEIREELKMDKGAAARRTARLEEKGYLIRKPNPDDGRSTILYPTEKANDLKDSKASIETTFYEFLIDDLSEEEIASFCMTLDKLYIKSKKESRSGFPNVIQSILSRR